MRRVSSSSIARRTRSPIISSEDENGNDVSSKLAEIGVGIEPRCVAVSPTDVLAFVTNGASGTVSVVNLVIGQVVQTITVGTEPRGCALTSDGSLLYVANHTDGTVSIISTAALQVAGTVKVGRNPTAIAITDKGTASISDDTVFVTEIFAELIPHGPGEGRDLGKQGVVFAFPAGVANPPVTKIILSPLHESGFSANRVRISVPAHIQLMSQIRSFARTRICRSPIR